MKTNIKSISRDNDITAQELYDIDTIISQHSDGYRNRKHLDSNPANDLPEILVITSYPE